VPVSDTWSLANPVHRFEFKPLHNNHDAPREGDIMLIQYFTRPSRIDELRNCPGGHLLEASPRNWLRPVISGWRRANTFGQPSTFCVGSDIWACPSRLLRNDVQNSFSII
jgi:hypothetical protein